MRAVANSPKFAKKVGVPQSVGKEFEMKDKEGKMMKSMGRGMAKATMAKKGMKGYEEGKKVSIDALKAHAAKPASKAHKGLKAGRLVSKGEHSVQTQSKRGAEMVKMQNGGMPKTKMMAKRSSCK
jgi:nitrogen fixation protein FixH